MKSHFIVLLALFIMPWIVNAVKVVECEDAQGDKTYQTACPPAPLKLMKSNLGLDQNHHLHLTRHRASI